MEKIDLKSLTYSELEAFVLELGEPRFRAGQIFGWLYQGIEDFSEMTNISKKTQEKLKEQSFISTLKIEKKLVSKIDGTVKYLFELADGNFIETVVMKYKHGLSICISSQVGCRMGCRFCASTLGGLVRNLTTGEILNQVIFASKDIGERIGNIVMMGIGEPLDNFDNVSKFLDIVNDERGLGISYRHISLSTCGVVAGIYELAKKNLPITLCISLHAPDDKTRDEIMPINHAYNIDKLLQACKHYQSVTTRRITFEYSLISGVNDSLEIADKLSDLLRGIMCHVNLIPVNPVAERGYKKGTQESVRAFSARLTKRGINATVRRELGSDISASCGQLRNNRLEE